MKKFERILRNKYKVVILVAINYGRWGDQIVEELELHASDESLVEAQEFFARTKANENVHEIRLISVRKVQDGTRIWGKNPRPMMVATRA